MKMMELKEEMAGMPVTLGVGERMRVMLRQAGGTGYRWRAAPGCETLLHLERDEMGESDGRPGASVSRSWDYKALGEGTCELRFESVRSWEKAVTGKVVSFPVTVRARR